MRRFVKGQVPVEAACVPRNLVSVSDDADERGLRSQTHNMVCELLWHAVAVALEVNAAG